MNEGQQQIRENRYEGRWSLINGAFGASGGTVSRVLEFTECKSCGSLVVLGAEDLHEQLHPRISRERGLRIPQQ